MLIITYNNSEVGQIRKWVRTYTVEPRYTEMRYTEYLLYRSNRLSPFFSIFKFDRYNEF